MLDLTKSNYEYGEKLFTDGAKFILTVVELKFLPEPKLQEIAFVGRSNVGKSTLINAIVRSKSLARASNTPGRTQALNFFSVQDKIMLVDLPGYGFAKAPIPIIEKWTRLMKSYLKGRVNLARVCLLIDARRGIGKADIDMLKILDNAAVSTIMIMTKCDKIPKTLQAKLYDDVVQQAKKHPSLLPIPIMTSAVKHTGIDELRATLGKIVNN